MWTGSSGDFGLKEVAGFAMSVRSSNSRAILVLGETALTPWITCGIERDCSTKLSQIIGPDC